jgi:hypothetical protein
MEWMRRVLTTMEAEEWSELRSVPIHAAGDHGKILRLRHLLKSKWFDPEELARQVQIGGDE